MKRLYNDEYSSSQDEEANHIDKIMIEAVNKIWTEIVEGKDVCPRDAESACHQILSCIFIEKRMRRAIARRRNENARES